MNGRGDAVLLALKEGGVDGHKPGTIVVDSRSWKRRGNGFSPRASKKDHPADILILAQ